MLIAYKNSRSNSNTIFPHVHVETPTKYGGFHLRSLDYKEQLKTKKLIQTIFLEKMFLHIFSLLQKYGANT